MAEPGDPHHPTPGPAEDHDDDLIGFASPAALAGQRRAPAPFPTAIPSAADPVLTPAWAMETPAAPRSTFGRAGVTTPQTAEDSLGLYTVYALILFAVPTFGAAALLGLYAIWSRPAPTQALALSHHVFQQRTLWIAAVAAVAGAILIVVNLGVLVLFLAAVWLIVRGAWGAFALKAGRTIQNPTAWLIPEAK